MWKWKLLILSCNLLQVICQRLVGDHVCLMEERYLLNVTEHYVRNVTVRNYRWCMNVPPRCSFYTIKKINDTRIVEVPQTRTVEKCCPEFYEEDQHCKSYCSDCENGICRDRKCQCYPGFRGLNCDTKCELGFWGSNCTKICECEYQSCNPVNGSCTVSDDIENKVTIDEIFYSTTITSELSEYVSAEVETTRNFNENIFTTSNKEIPKNAKNTTVDPYNFNSSIIQEHSYITTEKYNNGLEFKLPNVATTEVTVTTLKDFPVSTDLNKINEQHDLIFSQSLNPIPENVLHFDKTTIGPTVKGKKEGKLNLENNLLFNENKEVLIPVEIKYDQIAKPLLQTDMKVTTSHNVYEGKTYLLTKDKIENQNVLSSHDAYVINTVSVSAATTVALIILAVIFLTVSHIRRGRREKKLGNKKNVGVSTVAVYTTSIFHTPLPDLPTFDNPSYITPNEYQNIKEEELKNFETHVVCNMNNLPTSPQTKPDFREYVYDHPPSTGSYRAASIVEPLDIDMNQKTLVLHTEPVYDEIPCRDTYEQVAETTPYDQPMSLYINTCGRTKF